MPSTSSRGPDRRVPVREPPPRAVLLAAACGGLTTAEVLFFLVVSLAQDLRLDRVAVVLLLLAITVALTFLTWRVNAHSEQRLLDRQLEAVALAARRTSTAPWVMAPMVATAEETEYFVAICRDYDIRTAGVMVEVPASALLADRVLTLPLYSHMEIGQVERLADAVLRIQAHAHHPGIENLGC